MRQVMLSTFDNPYDPFDDFDEWFHYDTEKGYNSCAYLGRIAKTSNMFSDTENSEMIEDAIDEILKYDPFDLYIKVYKDMEEI